MNRYFDFAGTIGKSEGSFSGSYVYNRKSWIKKKWEAGVSFRWTSYFGTGRQFITAPAKLARTNTTPFLIFFAGQRKETQDTLTVQHPSTSSVNLAVNIAYNLTPTWSGGFNIDVVGFTFGRKSAAVLASDGKTQAEPAARPAGFNLLLTGDHDRGTLNSEFFCGIILIRHGACGRFTNSCSWNTNAIG